MIGIGAGIDDVADRTRRELADLRDDLFGFLASSRVNDHDAIDAELDGDVGAVTGDDVEIGPQLNDFEFAGDCRWVLLRDRAHTEAGNTEYCDGHAHPA